MLLKDSAALTPKSCIEAFCWVKNVTLPSESIEAFKLASNCFVLARESAETRINEFPFFLDDACPEVPQIYSKVL